MAWALLVMRKMNQSLKELKEDYKKLKELESQHSHKGFQMFHKTGKITKAYLTKGANLADQLQAVVVEINRREGTKVVLLGF